MKIFADYILRLLIAGTLFSSVSGFPENKLLSARGIMGITTSLLFLGLSIYFRGVYIGILEIGIKGIALLIGGLLLLGFVLQPILNGLKKLKSR